MNKYIFIGIPLLSIISLFILSVSHLQCVWLKGVNCNQCQSHNKKPINKIAIENWVFFANCNPEKKPLTLAIDLISLNHICISAQPIGFWLAKFWLAEE